MINSSNPIVSTRGYDLDRPSYGSPDECAREIKAVISLFKNAEVELPVELGVDDGTTVTIDLFSHNGGKTGLSIVGPGHTETRVITDDGSWNQPNPSARELSAVRELVDEVKAIGYIAVGATSNPL